MHLTLYFRGRIETMPRRFASSPTTRRGEAIRNAFEKEAISAFPSKDADVVRSAPPVRKRIEIKSGFLRLHKWESQRELLKK